MSTTNTPPPSPTQGATEGIWVSCTIEKSFERVQFNINELIGTPIRDKSWKLCSLPADQIKLYSFFWDQIQSAPGIYTPGLSKDGKFYEVAIASSYIPWLLHHKFELDFDYDPTEPADADVRNHGAYEAKKKAEAHFLEIAVKAIQSGPRGLRLCYFEMAQLRGLQITLHWAILKHDILESNLQVRKKFIQGLVFLGLNLLTNYDTYPALELLSKDEDELLLVIADRSKTQLTCSFCEEIQLISLVRCLLEFSGGREDFEQHKFDREFTANKNANLCGELISITGSNLFGDFDLQKMRNALSKSKVFTDEDIRTLDIIDLSIQMMMSIPIGFTQGHLDLPAQVLHNLSKGHVDDIGVQITHFYHQQPSLSTPENNVLLLLIWSSTAVGHPLQVLTEWAASDDGLNFYQRLTRDIQNSHTTEQLELTLAALLCHKQLLPYTLNDTTQPTKGSYLADFDALIKGEPLSNGRAALERILHSFFRVLETCRDGYQNIRQFLAPVVNRTTPLLDRFDGFSDQYWIHRTRGLTHDEAFGATKLPLLMEHCVVEARVALDVNGEEGWMMIESLNF